MLDSYETAFERRLVKAVHELMEGRVAQLVQGVPKEYPDYRERVGYLRACDEVLKEMAAIRAELNGESRDGRDTQS